MLLKAGAHLNVQDTSGNSILHLLVIHNRIEMYNYMLSLFHLVRNRYHVEEKHARLFLLQTMFEKATHLFHPSSQSP